MGANINVRADGEDTFSRERERVEWRETKQFQARYTRVSARWAAGNLMKNDNGDNSLAVWQSLDLCGHGATGSV